MYVVACCTVCVRVVKVSSVSTQRHVNVISHRQSADTMAYKLHETKRASIIIEWPLSSIRFLFFLNKRAFVLDGSFVVSVASLQTAMLHTQRPTSPVCMHQSAVQGLANYSDKTNEERERKKDWRQ